MLSLEKLQADAPAATVGPGLNVSILPGDGEYIESHQGLKIRYGPPIGVGDQYVTHLVAIGYTHLLDARIVGTSGDIRSFYQFQFFRELMMSGWRNDRIKIMSRRRCGTDPDGCNPRRAA